MSAMKLETLNAAVCLPLPSPLLLGEVGVRVRRMGEGRGEGAQLTRDLEQTIAGNGAEILEA